MSGPRRACGDDLVAMGEHSPGFVRGLHDPRVRDSPRDPSNGPRKNASQRVLESRPVVLAEDWSDRDRIAPLPGARARITYGPNCARGGVRCSQQQKGTACTTSHFWFDFFGTLTNA